MIIRIRLTYQVRWHKCHFNIVELSLLLDVDFEGVKDNSFPIEGE